ncbi:MAG: TetR family transcriptional regulator [Oscillatoriales cyanobacterium]|uniref:TetR/AcrR family transcriptional regulator C-terminal domain-containing protein n=1 Tax=Microcoleus anatoxicus PTRS2 TaxID=2705321 RepID=A0ABU8YN00_9CYAN|nr:MAG: TetR family transcriptional regulator [Oscillatoriales cyanobacterium]TAD94923.1 MAG: TetR family transcriptional regulator [Oscillatoriales cyanobacterium]TAE01780.1 MAG: TetR family transcriptional regulator [Oscillatoriales cyanobacterium]TAF01447.1 MAG: TetR family transcriptional regulator [Oscillatoriales cyanobacterium]TAF69692.1 MAG: TetR family transcriptional regulator [Oscillatoriales cyanobacterium]
MAKTIDSDTAPQVPLSRERVLRAAIRMADEGGIESLSMRKLAQELGVQAMSLYNHVANKDDILDGIVDIVGSEIEVPNLGIDWKTAMRRRAISAHEVLVRHPWATMAIMSRVNVGPAMLRYVDATLGCLCEAGFSLEMADRVWNAIDSHIYGFTLQELNFPFEATEYSEAAKTGLSLIPADKYPYLNRLTHYVIEGRYNGIHDFEFGLELLLNSLDQFRDKV